MQFTIEKDDHYSNKCNLPIPKRIKDSEYGEYKCTIRMAHLPTEPQDFYSKLIGVCHILGTRYRSERIGWRFIGKNCFELAFFSEKNRKFEVSNARVIQATPIDNGYELSFVVGLFKDRISLGSTVKSFKDKDLCYLAKPYFGGNLSADQNYYFTFDKID